MADNVQLSAGTADGIVLATDDVAGVHYQIVKVSFGALDTASAVSSSNGLPVAQQGTWNVNNVSGTVSLPTGAATAAKQPALGTAGAASTDVLTIQGIASMTKLLVTPDSVALPANQSVNCAQLAGTATDTNSGNKSAGTLRVVLATDQPALTNKLLVTPDSVALPANQSVNVSQINGVTPLMGNGATGTGSLRVTIANDNSAITVASHAVTNAGTFAVQESGTHIQADDAAFTPATSKVTMAGYTADESSTDSVDEGDGGAARMTLDRKQITTLYVHAAAGGATPYKNIDCDETEDDIKTSAGKLFWIHVMNLSTGVRYLKLYNNTAANVTVGTTVPDLTFPIPTMADTNGAGFCVNFGDAGLQFTTAICVAATTGLADNNAGAPGTNDVVLNAGYL